MVWKSMMHDNAHLCYDLKTFAFCIWCQTWHDDMTREWFCMMESMFSHLKYKDQNIVIEIKIPKCMMKNLLCSVIFLKFFFLESIVLFVIIKLVVFFLCFWNWGMSQTSRFNVQDDNTHDFLSCDILHACLNSQTGEKRGYLEGFWGNRDNNVDTSFITHSLKGDVICEFRMKNTRDPKIAPVVV